MFAVDFIFIFEISCITRSKSGLESMILIRIIYHILSPFRYVMRFEYTERQMFNVREIIDIFFAAAVSRNRNCIVPESTLEFELIAELKRSSALRPRRFLWLLDRNHWTCALNLGAVGIDGAIWESRASAKINSELMTVCLKRFRLIGSTGAIPKLLCRYIAI